MMRILKGTNNASGCKILTGNMEKVLEQGNPMMKTLFPVERITLNSRETNSVANRE